MGPDELYLRGAQGGERELAHHINRKIGSSVLPMIIEIPDKDGSSEGSSDQINDLIKRVIGVEMVK